MSYWVNESVFYHIYPIGFCGAPRVNDGETVCRLDKVIDWIPHLKSMSVNAIYFGPVFKSTVHGYDTDDYRVIDNRLGTNESFKHICDENHCSISFSGLYDDVNIGSKILIDDGLIELKVIEKKDGGIICTVINGGYVL